MVRNKKFPWKIARCHLIINFNECISFHHRLCNSIFKRVINTKLRYRLLYNYSVKYIHILCCRQAVQYVCETQNCKNNDVSLNDNRYRRKWNAYKFCDSQTYYRIWLILFSIYCAALKGLAAFCHNIQNDSIPFATNVARYMDYINVRDVIGSFLCLVLRWRSTQNGVCTRKLVLTIWTTIAEAISMKRTFWSTSFCTSEDAR